MRRFFAERKHALLLLLGATLLCGASLVCVFTSYTNFARLGAQGDREGLPNTSSTMFPHTLTTPTAIAYIAHPVHVPAFEAGVAYPQWTPDGYSKGDSHWTQGLQAIMTQTHAYWIEMPLLFYQLSPSSTTITTGVSTPTVASFVQGVQEAHRQGYRVFVTPLVTVGGPVGWSGAISFAMQQDEREWFASYWQTLRPYVVAAQQNGVEQLAIGTEEDWLQQYAPDVLWNTLIEQIRTVFSGKLTYDTNWTALAKMPPSWMRNSNLSTIGVSAYLSLTETRQHVKPQEMVALWKRVVTPQLDSFAIRLGKPVIISEIGYRDSADTLYHVWESTSTAPVDAEEQAAACNAALANATRDPHIAGIFFWGWDNVGAFALHDQPAASVLYRWYSGLMR